MSSIEQVVVAGVAKRLIDVVFDRFQRTDRGREDVESDEGPIRRSALERSLITVIQWCGWTEDVPTRRQVDIETSSVGLSLTPGLRRQTGTSSGSQVVSDFEMLTDPHSCLLLGHPGAGKTTTLKRLARRLLTEDSINPADTSQYPLLIVCRNIEIANGLYRTLASILNIPYEQQQRSALQDERTLEASNYRADLKAQKEYTPIINVVIEDVVGKRLLKSVIAEYLEETGALLLVDGLDEIPSTVSRRFKSELAELGQNLSQGKVIASCRTGDFQGGFSGFSMYEICALNPGQMQEIAKLRLQSRADTFLDALRKLPMSELADRPLFLNYLIVIFDRNSVLPRRPLEVYKRVVRLLLEDWDKARGLQRISEYALFDSDRKREFLSALAYSLTYDRRLKTFSEQTLIELYHVHREAFGLPEGEAISVAQEIESHTGIIAESAFETFEFSHLVLQEYLCAEHLVRTPVTPEMSSRISSYVAPLAIAVGLSSSPSEWFAHLVLSSAAAEHWTQSGSKSFLSRLAQEQPHFERNERLGLAMLKLLHLLREEAIGSGAVIPLPSFLGLEAVRESIEDALHFFEVAPWDSDNELCLVHRKTQWANDPQIPALGAYPRSICRLPTVPGAA